MIYMDFVGLFKYFKFTIFRVYEGTELCCIVCESDNVESDIRNGKKNTFMSWAMVRSSVVGYG